MRASTVVTVEEREEEAILQNNIFLALSLKNILTRIGDITTATKTSAATSAGYFLICLWDCSRVVPATKSGTFSILIFLWMTGGCYKNLMM